MKIQPKDKRALLAAAMGRTNCDLAVTNCQYVNVFTGEIYPATVYIHQGFVIHVDDQLREDELRLADRIVDAGGRYLTPGLIDAHIHIESSMMTPRNFAEAVVPCGVTAVITDPHEMGNVFGEEAVRYMHDAGLELPMHQFIDIPSCVPAVPGLETAGAEFDPTVVDRLAQLPNVIGLAEVMDFIGVANGTDRMMDFIEAAERNNLYIQGHISVREPQSRLLSAYLIGGPKTCHETTDPTEARMKLRGGMWVDARDSSICKNVEAIWEGVRDLPWKDRLNLCTDDRESDDILKAGQLDDVLRHIIELGMDPLEAIRACTIHAGMEANIENIGAIAPGYTADFLLVNDLKTMDIESVWFAGEKVAEHRKLIVPIAEKHWEIETRNSVNVPELTLEDFRLRAPEGSGDTVKVSVQKFKSHLYSFTELSVEDVPVKDGCVDVSGDDDLFHAMIINRYGTGRITHGLTRNFSAKRGAYGSTVSHDSHNLCIVFKTPEDGYAVYKEIKEIGGGFACANDGKVLASMALRCGGLMSNEHAPEVAREADIMKKALREELGMPQKNPILRIVTLALPVAPAVKFSDLGLIDVMNQKFIPIFPEA